ncbi:hypothetical protein ACJJTC_006190 [Scirpophaga incertulas]
MDLSADPYVGVRNLSPRHISADKTNSKLNDAFNTTLLCHNYSLQPDFGSYLAALQSYAVALWLSGFAILLTVCCLYGLTLRSVWRHSRSSLASAAVVLAVYPVVAASSYVATIVPRAMLLCEAIAQQVVMVAMYHFYCMMLTDCGGAEKLVSRTGENFLETRVLPCCCWPCCVIPRPQLEKRNLLRIRYLVLQLPVIQALIYITLLIIWAEDMLLYVRSVAYVQPLVVASILAGVWGAVMCARAAEAAGARPRRRLLALQVALLVVKLQCGAVKMLPQLFALPCVMALHPSVFVNLLQNTVTMVEMLLLALLAWRLYSSPSSKFVDKIQRAVMANTEDSLEAKAVRH